MWGEKYSPNDVHVMCPTSGRFAESDLTVWPEVDSYVMQASVA